MKNDKETKKKLVESAKKEFIEKGYSKASLRNICKDAGMTTGALYFFFQNKADLFSAVVDEPLQRLKDVMWRHYNGEAEQFEQGDVAKDDFSDDMDSAKQIIHYMYQNYDVFQLLLTKSQGSKYENFIDEFVAVTELHYREMVKQAKEKLGKNTFDDYMIHWMSHIHIDVFVHMITHEPDEDKAIQHVEQTVRYLIASWKAMLNG